MPEEDLKLYIPLYGDRIAVKQFCNNRTKPSRKLELLKKLQDKIKKKSKNCNGSSSSHEEDEEPEKKRKYGNEKSSRQVEIGWMCSLDGDKYKQVRTRTGGGTRKFRALKTMKKSALIQKGIELFFPGNISKMGEIEKFSVNLMDFKLSVIEDHITVEDMFQNAKFSNSKVRIYLATKEKVQTDTGTCSTETEDSSDHLTTSYIETVPTSMPFSVPGIPSSLELNEPQQQQETLTDETDYSTISLGYQNESNSNVVIEFENDITRFYSNYIPTDVFEDETVSITQDQEITETFTPNVTPTTTQQENSNPINLEYNVVFLRRGTVFDDLLQVFMTLDKDGLPIQIRMIGYNGLEECGQDVGGVFRDALSAFWSNFMDRCTVGANVKVPYIRHDFNAEKWEAIALVLYIGYKETNYFPIEIAKVFMEMVIFDRRLSDLNESFLSYVSSDDKILLEKAKSNFGDVDQDALLDVLSDLGCKIAPNERNISEILDELAHKELIQKGMFVINAWQKVLKNFISEEAFLSIYKTKHINSRNVLSLLSAPSVDLDGEKNSIFNYLKKFIRESTVVTLKQLLRFCTGADVIVGKQIQVNFNQRHGLNMVPTAHTCSCILELPVNYHDYPEFRSDFNSVLKSTDWSIDMI
ncbi:unnamed protein product [Ceutorhynchus assimilis]|uniref:HECT domain-containing protein n=1 Tax=Ceutorhynchus assimilis TaxID=467358 RepID=A0A9N9ML42_9CUCU|nr:unnamed protein product [Ceutorhynchus assimilis]